MSKITDWIQIARIGKFPQGNLTTEKFDQIVKTFNPENHEPPHVLGHITKEHNSKPAMGWISAIKRSGDFLLAKSKQVAGELDDLVRSGRFKKRSIGIRESNGKSFLHHLAWLGASSPACKGLANVYESNFNYKDENEDSQKSFEYEDENLIKKRSLKMREYSDAEIKALETNAQRQGVNDAQKEFDGKEKTKETEYKENQKKAVDDAVKKANDAKDKEFADNHDAAKQALQFNSEADKFIDEQFKAKKINPAQVKILKPLIYSLHESKEINYTEEEKGVKKEIKTDTFSLLKKVIEYSGKEGEGELDTPAPGVQGKDAEYAEESVEAKKIMKENSKLTLGGALIQARREIKARKAA